MLIQIHKTAFKIGKLLEVFSLLSIFILMLSGCGLFEKPDPYKRDKEIHLFFRCKVNGKEWHNYSYNWFFGDLSTIAYYSNTYSAVSFRGRLEISMDNDNAQNDREHIFLAVKNELKLGNNKITKVTTDMCFHSHKNDVVKEFYLDSTYNNNLYITEMDSTNSIIKGEFEFKGITKDGKDTVLVNDGEFDWHVYWYK